MKTFFTRNRALWGENGCLSNLSYLLACQAASFSIHPFFPNTISQGTFGTLPLTVPYLCDLWNVMSCHWSKNTSHSILPRKIGVVSILRMCLSPQKLLSQKIHFQIHYQNCSLKNYLFKIYRTNNKK